MGGSDGMLRGEHQHSLDAKGRMILPARFRETLGNSFIVTRGLDKCLFVYSLEEWNRFEEKVQKLPVTDPDARKFIRFFFGGACEAEVDAQGRALLPQNLREYAGLTKEIVSIGVVNRVEIWQKENWDEYNGSDNFIDNELAKRMAELGI